MTAEAVPQILVPLRPITPQQSGQDIVVYLRPESNGISTESTLFKVLATPQWKDKITLSYLANLPGEFILRHRIVEHHYAVRLDFAARGRTAFTPSMRSALERFFGIPFEKAQILGAFEALQLLRLSAEELFQLWVPVYDILEIEGQLVKRLHDNVFVINYDIPALLHKNHAGTDVAVMLFRTSLDYEGFKPLIDQMREALIQANMLDPSKTERRVFHYSKGPFEQLLDALGYIWTSATERISLTEMQFAQFLKTKGMTDEQILRYITHPIGVFDAGGRQIEQNLFSFTLFDSYEEAWNKTVRFEPSKNS